jgi:hypothetical protein
MYKFDPGVELVSCSMLIQAYHISNGWNPWEDTAISFVELLQWCKAVFILGCNFPYIYAGTSIYICYHQNVVKVYRLWGLY